MAAVSERPPTLEKTRLNREKGRVTHSGLGVDGCSDSIHRHAQILPIFEVNAVVAKHITADTPPQDKLLF